MPGYKGYLRASLGFLSPQEEKFVNSITDNGEYFEEVNTASKLKELAENYIVPTVLPSEPRKNTVCRAKPGEQIAKQVAKRRKKNKNKKTHRKHK